ncbi:MAG: helix-turn-helix transcriptional regulator [Eubacterium sp.]|nr:helix-turn-helix transcriptional regulator [Eubacterium sp.]
MDEKGINRNMLARAINTRFEVIDKWYNGRVEKIDADIFHVSALYWNVPPVATCQVCIRHFPLFFLSCPFSHALNHGE